MEDKRLYYYGVGLSKIRRFPFVVRTEKNLEGIGYVLKVESDVVSSKEALFRAAEMVRSLPKETPEEAEERKRQAKKLKAAKKAAKEHIPPVPNLPKKKTKTFQSEFPEPAVAKDGDVATHCDNDGHHKAIVLRVVGDKALSLFFTSNPRWGRRKKRLATSEELSLAGMRVISKTYLSPAIRPARDFVLAGFTFPSDRVEELYDEFYCNGPRSCQ